MLASKNYREARSRFGQPEINAVEIIPFGRFGAGIYTAHPIGLVVAGAVVFTAWRIPAARDFSLISISAGAALGLLLWLKHRRREFPSPPSLVRKSRQC